MSVTFSDDAYKDGAKQAQFEINKARQRVRRTGAPELGYLSWPENPWPATTPEGEAWVRGWNDVVIENQYPEEVR